MDPQMQKSDSGLESSSDGSAEGKEQHGVRPNSKFDDEPVKGLAPALSMSKQQKENKLTWTVLMILLQFLLAAVCTVCVALISPNNISDIHNRYHRLDSMDQQLNTIDRDD